MADDIYLQMQKLANQTQIKLQDMSDKTTAKTFKYNTEEAAKQRKFNKDEAAKSRAFNKKEAEAARTWQEMMSNTSHQREVKDLKKAGLNPVLSVNQGAQSYTTSSAQASAASANNASAEAENPSNAVAALMSSQMSGMAGVRESEISAAATKHAAATSAAAQKAAAAQAAAAQRYAADMAYRTSAERNEAQLEMTRLQNQNKLDVIDKTPPQNLWSLAWKAADQTGLKNTALASKFANGIRNSFYMALNNPKELFVNTGKAVTAGSYYLSNNGYKIASRCLNELSIRNTAYARDMLIKGVVFHQPQPMKVIAYLFKTAQNPWSGHKSYY